MSANPSLIIGNGDYVKVKEIGKVSVQTPSCTKFISDVLYVPNIDQNLISVGQLIEKNYTLIFKDSCCTILDQNGFELMNVKMKHRSFPLIWKNENDDVTKSVEEKQEVTMEEQQHLSSENNSFDIKKSVAELEKLKKDMKMMEITQEAAKQAQAEVVENSKPMKENQQLKAVIKELRRTKSTYDEHLKFKPSKNEEYDVKPESSISRNASKENVDAPLQRGVDHVYKQPGIGAVIDEDDFIEVKSRKQMLIDRHKQKETEIKAKSRVIKHWPKENSKH